MNKNKLKAYAPAARRAFIQAVSDRANLLGLSKDKIIPADLRGDVTLIDGRAYPKEVAAQHARLAERIRRDGFDKLIEETAYCWFNRFTALRYMEVHGYLDHGYCILSNPNGSHIPEILEQAANVTLPGTSREQIIAMKLANKDAELYRLLLVAQCNALNTAMPFLFERINDETELLLPDNLLHTQSIIRKLVTEIDEEDWQQVEIIGWLYQFYISEKKDQVIGKVVKSEDIPAATQLFTPNWIVKYMTQNSLGRMWLATYPDSPLRGKMEYYIEPAEQTDEVKAQLAAITPKEIDPESITVIDPACGSGHILVEAYDLLKEIYLERGYRSRDIPRLILQKNLYGLDIDDRAAQLAAFALLMKARADDRRIFDRRQGTGDRVKARDQTQSSVLVNVLAIQSSAAFEKDFAALADALTVKKAEPLVGGGGLFPDISRQQVLTVATSAEVTQEDIRALLGLFKDGKTYGSLITVPDELAAKLEKIARWVEEKLQGGDLIERTAAEKVLPFVRQAEMLARKYDCVIANPPYMNSKYVNPKLKQYLKENYRKYDKDLFASFVIRNLELSKLMGQLGFMSPFVWMFISSYEELRLKLIDDSTLTTLIQLEYSGFDGATVPICTFTVYKNHISQYVSSYIRLSEFRGAQNQAPKTLEAIRNPECDWFHTAKPDDFKEIPGSPIGYWASNKLRALFLKGNPFRYYGEPRMGMATGNNDLYLRFWSEVNYEKIGFGIANRQEAKISKKKWFPYNKGGEFRLWYGNNEYVVNWENDGYELQTTKHSSGRIWAHNFNLNYIFQPSITWTATSSSYFGVRFCDTGFLFDCKGSSAFVDKDNIYLMLGLLSSKVAVAFLKILNPTIEFQSGDIGVIPVLSSKLEAEKDAIETEVLSAINLAREEWNSFETSWDFQISPLLREDLKDATAEDSFNNWQSFCAANIKRMQELETENNRLFIEAYGLEDELTPEVPEDQITLARADREADIKRLLSYAVGCMMGRYSLDKPGLIYANAAGVGFDQTQYTKLAADEDGIIPVTDLEWFADDAANRFAEFLRVAWSTETLDANLQFVADSLSLKQTDTPRETIRRYYSAQFYKDHLQTYKKRPIYWLFTSGKQRAFECLVYLHRYNESTLSRMRNEYVTPLFGKLSARIKNLEDAVSAATSTPSRNKMQRELDATRKKQIELQAFDELLRHYADQRIALDLDDGVKVNYARFGKLLADAKAITGESK